MDSDQKVEVQCEKCNKDIYILADYFDYATINNQPIICEGCLTKIEKSLREAESQNIRRFEYLTESVITEDLNKLGSGGWELISIYDDILYFKRELL